MASKRPRRTNPINKRSKKYQENYLGKNIHIFTPIKSMWVQTNDLQ